MSYKPDNLISGQSEKHIVALYVHVATATKRLVIYADEIIDGVKLNGSMIANVGQEIREPTPTEVVVGVYGRYNRNQTRKKFRISLNEYESLFFSSFGH